MKRWLWSGPGRLVLGAIAGGALVTLAGQATAAIGSACLLCEPLLAAPLGAVLGGIALWRIGDDEY